MSWNRWGQSDPTYSQAKADGAAAEAEAKAVRARDLKAAKERKKAEKAANKTNKNK